MNEVRPTQLSPPVVNRAASSQGADAAKELPLDGKELPVKEVAPQDVVSKKPDPEKTAATEIEEAVTEINEYVQSVQRDLHFSVDEDSGITIVRVRDKESGELIRQIPEDVFLNLAQKLKDNQTLHLLDAHG
ncbi:MAG: flagellar protein FlaG [Cellvibrionaceae bacterium]